MLLIDNLITNTAGARRRVAIGGPNVVVRFVRAWKKLCGNLLF